MSVRVSTSLKGGSLMAQKTKMKLIGELLADIVAEFGGSWTFVSSFVMILIGWMVFNTFSGSIFDPYPFVFLNLVLSCIAALQAPILMMSQTRQNEKDRILMKKDFDMGKDTIKELREMNLQLRALAKYLEATSEDLDKGGKNGKVLRAFEDKDLED